jgi:3',5'-cyclic AMP phosphodiesterase CpdA
MTRIIHLSDLHFGRERPELLRPLIAAMNDLGPDLVAISGDLTQRARAGQYRAVRAFLAALEPPVICVPGNHDTPLHNPIERLFDPWARYRRYIADDLEPSWVGQRLAVHGVNTVNPLFWQRGHVRRTALTRLCRAMAEAEDRLQIVMVHHPLEHRPGTPKRLARGAERALSALAGCGADVILCGHLHSWRASPFRSFGSLLIVQAGTGLSTRLRDEPNDFNLLSVDAGRLTVERFTAREDGTGFVSAGRSVFRKPRDRWFEIRDPPVLSARSG